MKNKLKRELNSVRVDDALKRRIIAEAAQSCMPSIRKNYSFAPLAAAAAMLVVLSLTVGATALRTEHVDRSSTALSASESGSAPDRVWISEEDGLYHSHAGCAEGAVALRLDEARAGGRKACPDCIPEGSPAAEGLVWITGYGNYCHRDRNCSGTAYTVGVLAIEAQTLGRQACPVCMSGESLLPADASDLPTPAPTVEPALPAEESMLPTPAPTVTAELPMETLTPAPERWNEQTLATTEAAWNAEEWLGATAEPTPEPEQYDAESFIVMNAENGEILGAVSFPENVSADVDAECNVALTEEMSVWTTDYSAYYHLDEHCSGMESAYEVGVTGGDASYVHAQGNREAVLDGKMPCPVCMAVNGQAEVVYDAEEMSVWSTAGGKYYHAEEHCSGMRGAAASSESEAMLDGKMPCPVCLKPTAEYEHG